MDPERVGDRLVGQQRRARADADAHDRQVAVAGHLAPRHHPRRDRLDRRLDRRQRGHQRRRVLDLGDRVAGELADLLPQLRGPRSWLRPRFGGSWAVSSHCDSSPTRPARSSRPSITQSPSQPSPTSPLPVMRAHQLVHVAAQLAVLAHGPHRLQPAVARGHRHPRLADHALDLAVVGRRDQRQHAHVDVRDRPSASSRTSRRIATGSMNCRQ